MDQLGNLKNENLLSIPDDFDIKFQGPSGNINGGHEGSNAYIMEISKHQNTLSIVVEAYFNFVNLFGHNIKDVFKSDKDLKDNHENDTMSLNKDIYFKNV